MPPAPAPARRDPRFISPLRYPGGKGRLAPYLASLVRAQSPRPTVYAEPFAGGAGAGLKLLVDELVDELCINDVNPGVAALWRALFDGTGDFLARIATVELTVDQWHQQRAIYMAPEGQTDLELGFATFYLNRCNRSGILDARPIGGLEQTGQWKIDARFHRQHLIERVAFIADYRDRVTVTQLDAREFITQLEANHPTALLYVDPPYIVQGDDLYLDRLSYDDHRQIASQLATSRLRWFLTYDCDDRIPDELYPGLRCAQFNIAHTAQRQHVGREYAVYSDHLDVPSINILPRDEAQWLVV